MVALASINDAPDAAYVRIAGKVVSENKLIAPVSGRPCTCYTLWVRTVGKRGRRRHTYEDAREFDLVDATGIANVPAESVHLEVSADHIHNTTPARLSSTLQATLTRLGVTLEKVSEIVVYEGIVADGDEIEVVGVGMRKAVPADFRERGFRDVPGSLFELRGAVHVLGARREITTFD